VCDWTGVCAALQLLAGCVCELHCERLDACFGESRGLERTFAMTGTTGNWYGDGTGGNNIYYLDAVNNPGVSVLCDNSGSPTCSSLLASGDLTFASLGTKMTDISVGDGVYASNVAEQERHELQRVWLRGGGDFGDVCQYWHNNDGLTVVYQVPTQPTAATATCILKNSAAS